MNNLFILFVFYFCKYTTPLLNEEKSNTIKEMKLCSKECTTFCITEPKLLDIKFVARSPIIDNNGMVFINGGTFEMGNENFADASPVHKVSINSFWVDETEVTNAQFEAFVKATNYVTVAERQLNPDDFPGIPIEKLVAGSAVFTAPSNRVNLDDYRLWWKYVQGANWRHPEGPGSNIIGKENYPVVQVCFEDAEAYAKWAGKRLLTEAEWEYIARAGRSPSRYYWGNELKPRGHWQANLFQGEFPYINTVEDGYIGTSPIKTYPKNPYGIYDLEGNVWEWCSDLYSASYYKNSPKTNPLGPSFSLDPDEPGIEKHVQRGGSYLCSSQYCVRYIAGSRGKGETYSASNHLGFRCAK